MTPSKEVDYIVHDCLFAMGQAVGPERGIDYGAVVWLRSRYRDKFLSAIVSRGNSWTRDRRRVMAVSRYLAHRASEHAREHAVIGIDAIERASAEVEHGCRMNEIAESGLPSIPAPPAASRTDSAASSF
jgi:hypothetical protein